jgi:integrase
MADRKPGGMRDGLVKRGGSWSYVVRINGKPKWVGGFRTRDAAKRARDEARARLNAGTYVLPSRTTFGDYLDAWLAARTTLTPGTRRSYGLWIANEITPELGHFRLQDVNAAMLDQLYARLHGRGLSWATVRLVHSIIRRALADALKRDLVATNAATKTTQAEQGGTTRRQTQPASWTAEEVRAFAAAVEDDRLRALWLLYVTVGLRRGEALALRWSDVDLDAGTLRVTKSLVAVADQAPDADGRRAKRIVEGPPKTRKGTRTLALGPVAVEALRRHRREQLAEQLATGIRDLDERVFTAPDGGPIMPDHIFHRFRRIRDGAGLRTIRMHDLRHTAATLGLSAGVPVKIISERLGHANIGITLDIYAHVLPADDAAAAARFDAHVFGTAPEG